MSLLDTFTGGKSGQASDDAKRAEDYFTHLKTPTLQELTLPQLQQYVEAGVMTPAEAQAYLQQSNSYNNQNIDQTGTAAEISALNRLAQIADAGPEGTPIEQMDMANTINQLNTSVGGQRGAIEQQMAARGTPAALIQGVLENQSVGQDAQQAHLNGVNAQAAAYQAAINAMAQGGALGGQLQGQQNAQSNTVAGAQNAMQQFNAQNQQQNSQFNATNRQDANRMNTANKQQVSNNNVGLNNMRTQYNANLPQQMFNNDVTKASGAAGAATNSANTNMKEGQQNAAIDAGLLNLGSSFIPKASPSDVTKVASVAAAHGGYIDSDGRLCMADGGTVPGESNFPGDTEANDTVPASLSPGEAVIPRSSVAKNPDTVASLLGDDQSTDVIDVQDVATLLKAMRAIRIGAM